MPFQVGVGRESFLHFTGPVCMKTPHFPYILLPMQEIHVYFVAMPCHAMSVLCHALAREYSKHAR